MKNLLSVINPKARRQTEKLNPRQVRNNAGGFVYTLPEEGCLTRFLILGTDGGTFYAAERAHTVQATDFVRELVARDAAGALDCTCSPGAQA